MCTCDLDFVTIGRVLQNLPNLKNNLLVLSEIGEKKVGLEIVICMNLRNIKTTKQPDFRLDQRQNNIYF